MKIKRNAPCPCGSGKKAKRCVHDPPLTGDITPARLWWSSPDLKAERVGINDLYETFWKLPASPAAARIDAFLDRVIDEADECNPDWHDILHRLRGFNYGNIESFIWRVFDHVPDGAKTVDHDNPMAFFAWAATDIIAGKNPEALPRLVDVIAARKDTYDADGCTHIEEILTDCRCEDEILRYAESLQQRYANDGNLVAWAESYSTRRLIALRMARV